MMALAGRAGGPGAEVWPWEGAVQPPQDTMLSPHGDTVGGSQWVGAGSALVLLGEHHPQWER